MKNYVRIDRYTCPYCETIQTVFVCRYDENGKETENTNGGEGFECGNMRCRMVVKGIDLRHAEGPLTVGDVKRKG